MPALTNKIDTYTFEDLLGNVVVRSEQLEVFNRPGATGSGARKTGERGRPFTLRSVGFVLNWAAAETALANYLLLIGSNPVDLIQHSNNWGTHLVLSVRQVEARAVENAIGTIIADPKVRQVCEWTLLG